MQSVQSEVKLTSQHGNVFLSSIFFPTRFAILESKLFSKKVDKELFVINETVSSVVGIGKEETNIDNVKDLLKRSFMVSESSLIASNSQGSSSSHEEDRRKSEVDELYDSLAALECRRKSRRSFRRSRVPVPQTEEGGR